MVSDEFQYSNFFVTVDKKNDKGPGILLHKVKPTKVRGPNDPPKKKAPVYAIKPLVVPEIHPWTNKRRMQSDQFRQPPHDPEAAQRRSQQENILLAQILEGGIQDLRLAPS